MRSWRRGLSMALALGALACGEAPVPKAEPSPPGAPAPEVPAEPAPVLLEVSPPVAPTLQCLGDQIVTPVPASPTSGHCTLLRLDGRGNELERTLRRYDADGRLLAMESFGPGGEALGALRFTYDAAGRVTSMESGAQREQTAYDACGRTTQREEWSESGGWRRLTYHYDAAGREVLREVSERYRPDAELEVGRTQFTYDASGRLVRSESQQQAGARSWVFVEVFRYDEAGRPVEQSLTYESEGSVRRTDSTRSTYDAAGRLVRTERNEDGRITSVDYTYDAAGLLLRKQTESAGYGYGPLETYTYDAQGRPTELRIGEHLNGTPDVPERIITWRYPAEGGSVRTDSERDGTQASSTYDAQGREVAWSTAHFLHATFSGGSRTFDARGELLREERYAGTNGHGSSSVEERSYDAAGRLVRISLQREFSNLEPDGPLHTEQRYLYGAEDFLVAAESWNLDAEPAVLVERQVSEPVCRAPGS